MCSRSVSSVHFKRLQFSYSTEAIFPSLSQGFLAWSISRHAPISWSIVVVFILKWQRRHTSFQHELQKEPVFHTAISIRAGRKACYTASLCKEIGKSFKLTVFILIEIRGEPHRSEVRMLLADSFNMRVSLRTLKYAFWEC